MSHHLGWMRDCRTAVGCRPDFLEPLYLGAAHNLGSPDSEAMGNGADDVYLERTGEDGT
jgi:hypothetical protein